MRIKFPCIPVRFVREAERLRRFVGLRRRRFVVAGVLAAVLIVADYIGGNISYPVLDSSYDLSWAAYVGSLKNGREDAPPFLAANVAYDRELVTVYDEFGDTLGRAPVVDRDLLARFLRTIRTADYAYVLLDVRFEDGYESDGDSALFATLADMPRMAFAVHRGGESDDSPIVDERLRSRGAYADYRSLAHSEFSRYEFLQDGRLSMALLMYSELDGGRFCRFGPLYFDGWRLCRNMQFVEIPADAGARYLDDFKVAFPYMGAQLLKQYTPDELRNLVRGKIVLIGDFDADVHDTYVGPLPGPMIHYYAYRDLKRGHHIFGLWSTIVIWLVYFAISYVLLKVFFGSVEATGSTTHDTLKRWRRILMAMALFLGWNGVLITLSVTLFWLCGLSLGLALPGFAFTAIQLCSALKRARSV